MNFLDGIATELGLKKLLIFEINQYLATQKVKKAKYVTYYKQT